MSVDGSAISGKDYRKVDMVVVFKVNERSKFIKVDIIDDVIPEPDEDFFLQIMDPNLANSRLIGIDTRVKVTILDNDAPPN